MAAFVLNLTISGETQILSALSRFGEYAEDLTHPFEEMATDFKQIEAKRFAAQGPGWAPLSHDYAMWKAARYGSKPILQREGHLLGSLTGGAGFVKEITATGMVLGTSVKYARFHQKGTGRMPARKVVDFEAADRTRWAKILQRHLVAAARKANLPVEASA